MEDIENEVINLAIKPRISVNLLAKPTRTPIRGSFWSVLLVNLLVFWN